MLTQAGDSFDGNVAIQSEGQPQLLLVAGQRVGPEVLLIGAYLQATAPTLKQHGIDLLGSLRSADAATRGLDEPAWVALRSRCAFLVQGVCLIHRVRPLSCRGHASLSKRACVDAAAGRADEVPFSGLHCTVRVLVQSALQAALRQRGLAWGAYELNHALVLALDDDDAQGNWRAGKDPLVAAAVDQEFRDAMAADFDAVLH